MVGDYEGMAIALCNMGAADEEVDTKKFGRDIENVMKNLSRVQSDVTVTAMSDGTVQGSLNVDEEGKLSESFHVWKVDGTYSTITHDISWPLNLL
jgi:ABC-type molybdate transport system substrate-binding protein